MGSELIIGCFVIALMFFSVLYIMVLIATKNKQLHTKTPDSETCCSPKEFSDTYLKLLDPIRKISPDRAVFDLEGYKLTQPSTFITSTVSSTRRILGKRQQYVPRYIIQKFNKHKYQRRNRYYNA